ncbi:hypothetical protein QWZ16_23855 [Vibrio ostreicida]|uniref:Uncharacterized protein n=1 Tax=Vibrio ostreicida TaxID=526588 RepID=A0ABT8BZP3_9VIBR|nr:hypothetical protein [Vibrio ostreicida]MDN3612632.1 hypothetical protein [Vibrio ostreicida]
MSLDDALKQAVNNRKQPARSTFDQTEKTHSFESDCLSLAKETGFTFAAIQYMTTKAPDKTGFDFSQFKAESRRIAMRSSHIGVRIVCDAIGARGRRR